MNRLAQELMDGEGGLGTLQERVTANLSQEALDGGEAHAIERALEAELLDLAAYFEGRAERLEQLYGDLSLDGEREARCLRDVARGLTARATGVPPA